MRLSVASRACLFAIAISLLNVAPVSSQQLAKRLILKDGSYQLATEWQTKGERVRYFSAERGEWEEVPKSMVDWDATDKYAKERAAGAPPPEAVELDKQMAAERQVDEAKTPQVAPGLRLPEMGGVILFDSFEGQPQLVELDQSGSQINANRKGNIFRAAVNPVASAKQTIEIPGLHAKVQAHAALPAVYVNIQTDQGAAVTPTEEQELTWDRFKIVRVQGQTKESKRVVGAIKVAVYGKVSQEQNLVPTTAEKLTGGWVKVTPRSPLEPGEYAVAEMLGKEGMNLYVWDFGVNPAAPANMQVTKPEASSTAASPASPDIPELKKRR
jgi:hypothetical protein